MDIPEKLMRDCCITPVEQFVRCIMGRTKR